MHTPAPAKLSAMTTITLRSIRYGARRVFLSGISRRLECLTKTKTVVKIMIIMTTVIVKMSISPFVFSRGKSIQKPLSSAIRKGDRCQIFLFFIKISFFYTVLTPMWGEIIFCLSTLSYQSPDHRLPLQTKPRGKHQDRWS